MHCRNVLRVVGPMCLVFAAEAGAQSVTNGALRNNGAVANSSSVALASCRTAAEVMVRKAQQNVDSVRFSLAPQIERRTQSETDVRDIGAYFDKVVKEWSLFAIDCTYNYQAADARVSVTWAPGRQDDERARQSGRRGSDSTDASDRARPRTP